MLREHRYNLKLAGDLILIDVSHHFVQHRDIISLGEIDEFLVNEALPDLPDARHCFLPNGSISPEGAFGGNEHESQDFITLEQNENDDDGGYEILQENEEIFRVRLHIAVEC